MLVHMPEGCLQGDALFLSRNMLSLRLMTKDLECRVRRVVSEGFGGFEGNDLNITGVESKSGLWGMVGYHMWWEMKGRWFKIRVSG
jgi:hypothetical protein